MKKILSILICLLAFGVHAQGNPQELFDVTDKSIFGTSTEQTFTGKPVVLIEKKEVTQPEINKAEQLPPPDLSKNTLYIPIKTLFGHERTAAFLDHTTDFLAIVQVLDNDRVRVTEQIQFITTKDGEKFKRFFPNNTPQKQEFLSLKRDNSYVPFLTDPKQNGTEITYDKPLPKGVHRMTLEYLVSDSFKTDKSLAEIILPITGSAWQQIIERMTIVVMMPKKSRFYEKELLFGTNNQKIPENTQISEDEKGVLTFQITHPLPAYADVRMHLILDAQNLPVAPKDSNLSLKIIGVFTLILLGYTALSILVARFKKWKKPLMESKKINPILWAAEIGKMPSDYQLTLMENIQPSPRFTKLGDMWGKILAFLRFNCEYIIGVALLIIASRRIALYYGMEITGGIYGIFLVLSIIAVLTIDYYGTRKEMSHLLEILKKALLIEPQGCNLAKREIPTYYQIAVCFDFHEAWKKRMLMNNPSYKDLACFEKEKL